MLNFAGINVLTYGLGYIMITYYLSIILLNISFINIINHGFHHFAGKFNKEGLLIIVGTVLGSLATKVLIIGIKKLVLEHLVENNNNTLLEYTEVDSYILSTPIIGGLLAFIVINTYNSFIEYAIDSASFKLGGKTASIEEIISFAANGADEGSSGSNSANLDDNNGGTSNNASAGGNAAGGNGAESNAAENPAAEDYTGQPLAADMTDSELRQEIADLDETIADPSFLMIGIHHHVVDEHIADRHVHRDEYNRRREDNSELSSLPSTPERGRDFTTPSPTTIAERGNYE